MEDEHARQLAETTDNDNRAPEPEPPEDDTPLGWEHLIPGRDVFRFSPHHPDFPWDWLTKYTLGEYQRLDQSGEAAVAVDLLRNLWEIVEPAMQEAVTAGNFADWYSYRKLLQKNLEHRAEQIPISDRATRRAYLARRAYPEHLASLAGPSPPIPFEIVVNHSDTAHYEELAPGEIMIRLADTPTRHLTREFMTFVAEAQQTILGHKQRGRPRETDKAAMIAAAREQTSLTAWEIAGTLDMRSSTRDATRKRVARAEQRAAQQEELREQEIARAFEVERQAWEEFRRQRDEAPNEHETGQ